MRDDPRKTASGFELEGPRVTRLTLLRTGAAGVVGIAAAGKLAGLAEARERAASPTHLRFLTRREFELVTAMAEVIWPTDDLGPGARVAGVGYYIDGQLAGPWGNGNRMYMQGPFFEPTDSGHGWQVPVVPREVYRASLSVVDVFARSTHAKPFVQLDPASQNQVMLDLSTGKVPLPLAGATTFAGRDFFLMLRQNVLEGMLADPSYGGNRGMVGWKWIGFPGDPMRRGDVYYKYIFTNKPYPYEHKPLPLQLRRRRM